MICVTRAREIPSRRAISARDATSPASICRFHSTARCSRAAAPRGTLGACAAWSRSSRYGFSNEARREVLV